MKADRIEVLPFAFQDITYCEIEKAVNIHGSAKVKGYIAAEKEQEYLMNACCQTEVTITAADEDGSVKPLYCGILEDLGVRHENGVCMMEITIVPYTYLLDVNPMRRSFQIPSMTYQEVFNIVLGGYSGGSALMNTGASSAIGEPIVQYQETDWEFCLRLASHFQTVVVPSYVTSGSKLYVGLSGHGQAARISPVCYRAKKSVSEYLYKEQNQVDGIAENDSLWYIVEDQELYEIGEEVEFQGRQYCISRVESKLDGHQLWNTYYLCTAAGLKVPRQYNERIIGASLDGKITGVQADVVRVSLGIDAKSGEGKWFSFSTVYSSPDGSGWYCMPEQGDEIRLYFPTEKEKHAYVISAVHLPVEEEAPAPPSGSAGSSGGGSFGGDTGAPAAAGGSGKAGTGVGKGKANQCKRCDPNHKTFEAPGGKIVDLHPGGIIMDSGNGMRVVLDDAAGITITSPSNVTIKSEALIEITSLDGKVELIGSEGVELCQNDSKIEVASDNVVICGANSKVQ